MILTLDTKGMSGKPYQRPPYPMTWARMEGKGRVFYTAIGDRPENWSNAIFPESSRRRNSLGNPRRQRFTRSKSDSSRAGLQRDPAKVLASAHGVK